MSNTEQLNLLKSRTFGEKMGDTFTFIRLNFAVILKSHFLISVPVIIVTATAFVLLFRDQFSLLSTIESGPFADSVAWEESFERSMVSGAFNYFAILPVSIISFIIFDLYAKSDTGKVSFEEVWASTRKNYFKLLLVKLIMAPVIILPAFLLVLPGIAFYTLFLAVEMLILQHNYPIGRAMGRSSKIMGQNFWPAFWTNTAALLLYFIFGLLMVIPVEILELLKGMTAGVFEADSFWGIFLMALRGFITITSFLLFTIPTVIVGIQYFSIREKMARSGIMERIRMIGQEREVADIYVEDEQY